MQQNNDPFSAKIALSVSEIVREAARRGQPMRVVEVAVRLQERLRAEEIDVSFDEACAMVDAINGEADPQTSLIQSSLMMTLSATLHQLDAQVRANRECGNPPTTFQHSLDVERTGAEARLRSQDPDMARRALLELAIYTRAIHIWLQSLDHTRFRAWLARMLDAQEAMQFIHIDSGTTREQGRRFLIDELGSPDMPDLQFHTLLASGDDARSDTADLGPGMRFIERSG